MERCRRDLESPANRKIEPVMDGKPAKYDSGCDVEQGMTVVRAFIIVGEVKLCLRPDFF